MGIQKLNMKIEIDLGIDGEFEDLIKKVETKLYKEVAGGKVTLFIEYDMDLVHVKEDVLKLKAESNLINTIYRELEYPHRAIEFIETIREAEKYAQMKKKFQEDLFGIKYTEEQCLRLIVDTFRELMFSRHTFENAANRLGLKN